MGRTFIFLFLLALAGQAGAEDIQQTILLLPDEAAECRYLESVVAKASNTLLSTEMQCEQAESLDAQGKVQEAFRHFGALVQLLQGMVPGAVFEIRAALEAEKIKRGTLPSCAEPTEKAYKTELDRYLALSQRIQDGAKKALAKVEKGLKEKKVVKPARSQNE